jgi:ABC-2 type transport system ATP-binding protein
MIEIRDLRKFYGEKRVVGPLSVAIEPGEIVGLLGLNGAGKTTTLRILACDLLPSSGTVRVDGIDVVDAPNEVRKRIGYLPDTPPLYDEMTVSAYLRFAARLRGLDAKEATRRVKEVEEATSLSDVSSDPISSLSHGFRQRVGIAQAIVHRPRLLVLDEPISGLDPVQIVEMRELLKSLRGAHTILLSSHILSEISETCDRILVMRDGEIAASGTEQSLTAGLREGARIEVTLRGNGARAAELIQNVAFVTKVTSQPSTEPGEDRVTLVIDSSRDVREAVARAAIEAGLGLLGMARQKHELESVFLEIAGSGGGSNKTEGAPSSDASVREGPSPQPATPGEETP